MLKIAVLGSRETVMGFKALGLEVFPVSGADEAKIVFRRLSNHCENYAIIYVEENLVREIKAEIDRFNDMPSPAIILIPGRNGSLGLGQSALNAAVVRAVGSSI